MQDATAGDTATLPETATDAAEQIEAVHPKGHGPADLVTDKGYHCTETLVALDAIGVRAYISEPRRGRRRWRGDTAARDAVYRNRRRIGGTRGRRLLRRSGEYLERPCAHLYGTGRLRRVHLRGRTNILKRLLGHAAGDHLGLLMRTCYRLGTPRTLQSRAWLALDALWHVLVAVLTVPDQLRHRRERPVITTPMLMPPSAGGLQLDPELAFATGC